MIRLTKTDTATRFFHPLEKAAVTVSCKGGAALWILDPRGEVYREWRLPARGAIRFTVRGAAGRHSLCVLDREGNLLEEAFFTLVPRTRLACNKGPYAKLANRLQNLMAIGSENSCVVSGRYYRSLVCWLRVIGGHHTMARS